MLWNQKINYHVSKRLSLLPIPSQINPFHDHPFYVCKLHFNIIFPSVLYERKKFYDYLNLLFFGYNFMPVKTKGFSMFPHLKRISDNDMFFTHHFSVKQCLLHKILG
jgi:hypothetical protein